MRKAQRLLMIYNSYEVLVPTDEMPYAILLLDLDNYGNDA